MAHAWKACWVKALGGSNPPSSAGEGPVTCVFAGGGPFGMSVAGWHGPRLSPGNDARPVTELPGRTVSADRREFDDRVRALLGRLRSAVPVELGIGISGVGCVDPDAG